MSERRPVSRDAVAKTAATLHQQAQKNGSSLSYDQCRDRAASVANRTNNKRAAGKG